MPGLTHRVPDAPYCSVHPETPAALELGSNAAVAEDLPEVSEEVSPLLDAVTASSAYDDLSDHPTEVAPMVSGPAGLAYRGTGVSPYGAAIDGGLLINDVAQLVDDPTMEGGNRVAGRLMRIGGALFGGPWGLALAAAGTVGVLSEQITDLAGELATEEYAGMDLAMDQLVDILLAHPDQLPGVDRGLVRRYVEVHEQIADYEDLGFGVVSGSRSTPRSTPEAMARLAHEGDEDIAESPEAQQELGRQIRVDETADACELAVLDQTFSIATRYRTIRAELAREYPNASSTYLNTQASRRATEGQVGPPDGYEELGMMQTPESAEDACAFLAEDRVLEPEDLRDLAADLHRQLIDQVQGALAEEEGAAD